ncbi:DMT family transporter [Paracoccus sp. DMF-8]|uniref:DMT family transporter n=1 Tax=Paracoccus sp. DMF-8 TaxID=3019445 RepID=UPI0023E7C50F|nr:DMT family transporter [Paracoccus sp. DMF-8]MDF3606890.1 DMT family transporter [Paracoccus sp. DMF-8]
MQIPFVAVIFVILAGACISIQAPINAALGRAVQSPLVAAAISFAVGFVLLTLAAFASGDGRGFATAFRQDWKLWLGGILGAFYVWTIVWTLPRMGVVTAICAMALGQMVAAIILDRVGAFGLPVREVSIPRIVAALMVAGGLVLSRF